MLRNKCNKTKKNKFIKYFLWIKWTKKYIRTKYKRISEFVIKSLSEIKKNITIKNRIVKIQIWDTAGQEAFRSITRTYYKSSTCAFIVYDISDKKSFDNIVTWLNECRDMCYKDILICLIGNKCDLEGKRAVSYEEGKNFAEENNLIFFETSAKDGTNIQECFNESTTILVDKIESGQLKLDTANNGIKIGTFPGSEESEKNTKKKKKCCWFLYILTYIIYYYFILNNLII